MYLTLPNIESFGYVLISDQLQYNVNNLYIVLIFFLNVPIPCYIFIKQMSLLVFFLGGGGGGEGIYL